MSRLLRLLVAIVGTVLAILFLGWVMLHLALFLAVAALAKELLDGSGLDGMLPRVLPVLLLIALIAVVRAIARSLFFLD